MSFLHPAILAAGLLAIAIPIIIHFIRRRRRPIEWAAMRFLQDALRKRRRRLRLEQLLLLLTRCAIVALLALAIARPTSGTDALSRPTTHIIAIDNSIGSGAADGDSDTLTRSIAAARAIIDRAEASPGDSVAIVTLGAPGRPAVWPPTQDAGAARRALSRVASTDSRPTLNALRNVLAQRTADDDRPDQNTVLHLISSWRSAGIADALRADADQSPMPTVDRVVIHTATTDPANQSSQTNTAIASLSASTPSVVGAATLAPQTRVTGTLVRSAPDDAPLPAQDSRIELVAQPSGVIAGRAIVRFDAGQTTANWSAAIDEPALTPGRGGRIALQAVLLGEDANPLDDRASVVIARKRELRAAVVERPPVGIGQDISAGTWTLAALSPDERAGISSFRVDPASLGSIPAGSIDAMFILEPARVTDAGWTRAAELLAQGGLVVITPDRDTGAGASTAAWSAALATLSDGQIRINQNAGIVTDPARLSREPPAGLLGSLRGEFAELISSVGVQRRVQLEIGAGAVRLIDTDADTQSIAYPFMAQTSARGTLVVFAAPLDIAWTDLPARPVFVPIVQELVRRGSGLGIDTAAAAGVGPGAFEPTARINRWERDATMTSPDSDRAEGTPGSVAEIWLGLGTDGQVLRTLTLRPDADASRLTTTQPETRAEEIGALFTGAMITDQAAPQAGDTGRASTGWGDRVAFLLLAIAAALALLEAFLARTASHPSGAVA